MIVNRIKGKDFTSRSAFGNVRSSREWELTAKNLKKQKISVIVEDQIPVSVDKDITVNAVNISDADLTKNPVN